MGSGDSPGLQNRRTASLMSSVRSTRTRFRQFVFREMRGCSIASQVEIEVVGKVKRDKNVIDQSEDLRLFGVSSLRGVDQFSLEVRRARSGTWQERAASSNLRYSGAARSLASNGSVISGLYAQ
jgi:hypothetical protein